MTGSPKVSIVIVNYNGTFDTIECLSSLNKFNYPKLLLLIMALMKINECYLEIRLHKIWFAGGKLNMYLRHKTEGLWKVDRGKYEIQHETAGACMLIRRDVFETIGLPKEYFVGH